MKVWILVNILVNIDRLKLNCHNIVLLGVKFKVYMVSFWWVFSFKVISLNFLVHQYFIKAKHMSKSVIFPFWYLDFCNLIHLLHLWNESEIIAFQLVEWKILLLQLEITLIIYLKTLNDLLISLNFSWTKVMPFLLSSIYFQIVFHSNFRLTLNNLSLSLFLMSNYWQWKALLEQVEFLNFKHSVRLKYSLHLLHLQTLQRVCVVFQILLWHFANLN